MQLTHPAVSPASYMSPMPGSSTYTALPSTDVTFRIPTMRRVISSPSKHTLQLRDAAQSYLGPASRSLSHQTMTMPEYNHAAAEEIPAFLRDEYFTKQTKHAIKQMAEHRVLLDARNKSLQTQAAEDDEYAWYFNNPDRYVWRPRNRRAAKGKARNRVVLHGELGEECDAEMNRSLFIPYFVRYYGPTPLSLPNGQTQGTRRGSGQHACDLSGPLEISATPMGWGVDVDESEASTVFWLDEGDNGSSATVGNASVQHMKHSGMSSTDDVVSPRRSASSDQPTSTAYPVSLSKSNRNRWSSNSATSDEKESSYRRNSIRTRVGSHRRFSLFRLFST